MITIEELKQLNESEDKVEFKEAKDGKFSYNGGGRSEPAKRRRCILGYVVAFANEGGGRLVFGIADKYPHVVVGSRQCFERVGQLEADIYRDLRIRVDIMELYDIDKRVLIIEVPARPAGRVYKFEDVPLMRVGEELRPMSDEKYLKIIQEQEPDFSEKLIGDISIDDLSSSAIEILKETYSKKQDNPQFKVLSNKQVLTDLDLCIADSLTNAAVILLGTETLIETYFPQSKIVIEYRENEQQISFDNRKELIGPLFVIIDQVWNEINLHNGSLKIQEGPYIYNIPVFNKEVIREAILNAITHRDYRRTSEILIKQTSKTLSISSPGGFPIGVSLDNLLTTNSTPRNRKLADVLAKTGLVERSGQGIDKIYYQCITEAKALPDYSHSDDFQVVLKLKGSVTDKAFLQFIREEQQSRKDEDKLGVIDVLTLYNISKGENKSKLDLVSCERLFSENLIEKRGKTRGQTYVLAKRYFELTDQRGIYSKNQDAIEQQAIFLITNHLQQFKTAKMGDFIDLFNGQMTRRQVGYLIGKLVEQEVLNKEGEGKGTEYGFGVNFINQINLIGKALELGLEKLQEDAKTDTNSDA